MDLTHIDKDGNAIMVDVGEKSVTERSAVAKGSIEINTECLDSILNGSNKKGNVLGVAQIAGIEAAKKTGFAIPLCHILPLDGISVTFDVPEPDESKDRYLVTVECRVKNTGKTGVEMEALTGASVALLTIYDMCKAIDRSMTIREIYLSEKHGGRSGNYRRDEI